MSNDRMVIVVGVDFGEPSLAAVQWVARHFADAELVLVHSVFVPEPPEFLRGLYPPNDHLIEDARRGAEARMAELAGSLGPGRVQTEVRVGRPDEVLVAAATDRQAGLVVVGPHGERPGVWKLLGSTAERVVRRTPVAVLLARGLRQESPRRVLLALDESETRRDVLAWGARLQRRLGAGVVAMHVVNPLQHGAALIGASSGERMRVEDQFRARATAWVEQEAKAADLPDPLVHVAFGDAGFEVLSAITRFGAGLAVVGRHGASGTRGPLVGGVPEFLLRNGTGPVLIVPGSA
jgi:nucleotide-binding universal stress UspA family protein